MLGYPDAQIADIEAYAVGHGSLSAAPGINPVTLKQKGFPQAAIELVEKALPTAFDIKFVFNKWTLGEDVVANLGIAPEKLADPRFDLLAAVGFTRREIEAANIHVCGAMTVEGLRISKPSIIRCSTAPIRAGATAGAISRWRATSG